MAVADHIKEASAKSSWIRKMFEEGILLKAQYGSENVFDFSLGNPDIDPPKEFHEVFERLAREDQTGSHGYMPNAGYPAVRKKICAKVKREHCVDVKPDDIVMTVGAAGALNVVFKTIVNPGDEVIAVRPYFVEYGSYVQNHSGKLIIADSAPDFSLDISAIQRVLSNKTAAIIINSPNNPTGRIYSEDSIKALAAMLYSHTEKTGRVVYLIADEPYREIVYDGKKVPPVLSLYTHSIVATSYSKSLSLPGERIGYLAVNPECDDYSMLIGGLVMSNRVLGYVNAPALMQRIVAELTEVSVDVSIYMKRRDVLANALRTAGIEFAKPEGAFYIFCKSPIDDDVRFVNYFKEYKILGVPGTGFGCPGYFRLAYCVEDSVIERATPVFKEAMSNFKG